MSCTMLSHMHLLLVYIVDKIKIFGEVLGIGSLNISFSYFMTINYIKATLWGDGGEI